jgi:hypothetical protein
MLMLNIRPDRRWLASTAALVCALACPCLYSGVVMLLMIPGYPYHREAYLTGRVLYGVLPAAAAVALIVFAGWIWSRASGEMLFISVGRAALFSISLVALFFLALIVISTFR